MRSGVGVDSGFRASWRVGVMAAGSTDIIEHVSGVRISCVLAPKFYPGGLFPPEDAKATKLAGAPPLRGCGFRSGRASGAAAMDSAVVDATRDFCHASLRFGLVFEMLSVFFFMLRGTHLSARSCASQAVFDPSTPINPRPLSTRSKPAAEWSTLICCLSKMSFRVTTKHSWTDGRKDGQPTDGRRVSQNGRTDRTCWCDGRTDGRPEGWTADGRTVDQTDGQPDVRDFQSVGLSVGQSVGQTCVRA